MPVTLAGERVELHADRALFWPARARLVIADLHLGKGDIFRRHGIAVPSGGTGGDLARLDALIARTGAAELWVLGDMLHGDPAGSRWRAAWSAFRAAHRDLAIRVIAGNHDRALHAAALDVAIDAAAVRDGPFEFRHAPATCPGAHVLCGHLHPQLGRAGAAAIPGVRARSGHDDPASVLPVHRRLAGGPAHGRRGGLCRRGTGTRRAPFTSATVTGRTRPRRARAILACRQGARNGRTRERHGNDTLRRR